MASSEPIFYCDDYSQFYRVTQESVRDAVDITTITYQPYVWGVEAKGYIKNGVLFRYGVITVERQVLRPLSDGYEIVADGVSQYLDYIQMNFPCGGGASDPFKFHLNCDVADDFEFGVTTGSHWGDASTESPSYVWIGSLSTSHALTWDDVWAAVPEVPEPTIAEALAVLTGGTPDWLQVTLTTCSQSSAGPAIPAGVGDEVKKVIRPDDNLTVPAFNYASNTSGPKLIEDSGNYFIEGGTGTLTMAAPISAVGGSSFTIWLVVLNPGNGNNDVVGGSFTDIIDARRATMADAHGPATSPTWSPPVSGLMLLEFRCDAGDLYVSGSGHAEEQLTPNDGLGLFSHVSPATLLSGAYHGACQAGFGLSLFIMGLHNYTLLERQAVREAIVAEYGVLAIP